MQWGQKYRDFHLRAWREVTRVTRDWFLLNIKDHSRKGQRVPVSEFHREVSVELGWTLDEIVEIDTGGYRNSPNRVRYPELVYVFRK